MQNQNMGHLCKIRNARCIIDARPPQLNVGTFLRTTKMKEDNQCFKRIITENISLLEKLDRIQRLEGEVQSYNKSSATRKTRIQDIKKWLTKIDMENHVLGKKLLCMKPTMCTRAPIQVGHVHRTSQEQQQYLLELHRKYKEVMPVQNPNLIQKLLWPKIFIDLEVKNVRPLDRLVIVLCTEAAPNVVLQFVRMCKEGKNALKFDRIFPNLWIEGAIAVPSGTKLGHTERVNPHIDHGQAGTLALLERGTEGRFQFSISFKQLNVLNGTRVAFGKVIEGLKILAALQDYGTKNGKPKKEIVVTACGLVK